MIFYYQVFEVKTDGTLIALRDERDNAVYEYQTEEEALRAINSLSKPKPCVILKKYTRDYTILDDFEEGRTGI